MELEHLAHGAACENLNLAHVRQKNRCFSKFLWHRDTNRLTPVKRKHVDAIFIRPCCNEMACGRPLHSGGPSNMFITRWQSQDPREHKTRLASSPGWTTGVSNSAIINAAEAAVYACADVYICVCMYGGLNSLSMSVSDIFEVSQDRNTGNC